MDAFIEAFDVAVLVTNESGERLVVQHRIILGLEEGVRDEAPRLGQEGTKF